jgi:hypothetical protein
MDAMEIVEMKSSSGQPWDNRFFVFMWLLPLGTPHRSCQSQFLFWVFPANVSSINRPPFLFYNMIIISASLHFSSTHLTYRLCITVILPHTYDYNRKALITVSLESPANQKTPQSLLPGTLADNSFLQDTHWKWLGCHFWPNADAALPSI